MIRPEIVGEGTYGCVIKPCLKCKNKPEMDYTNKVSKVMNEYDAKKELDEYKSLSIISGIEKYAVTAPQLCKPLLDDIFLDSVKKCNTRKVRDVYNRNKSNLSMLILEDGGINLDTYVKKIFNRSTHEEQKIFLTSLINLIDGLLQPKNINPISTPVTIPNFTPINHSQNNPNINTPVTMPNLEELGNVLSEVQQTGGASKDQKQKLSNYIKNLNELSDYFKNNGKIGNQQIVDRIKDDIQALI